MDPGPNTDGRTTPSEGNYHAVGWPELGRLARHTNAAHTNAPYPKAQYISIASSAALIAGPGKGAG